MPPVSSVPHRHADREAIARRVLDEPASTLLPRRRSRRLITESLQPTPLAHVEGSVSNQTGACSLRRSPSDERCRAPWPARLLLVRGSPEQVDLVAGQLARVTRRWLVVFSGEMQVGQWLTAPEAAGARFVRLGIAPARRNPAVDVGRPPRARRRPDRHRPPRRGADALERRRASGDLASARGALGPGGQVHPAQKPIGLMRRLIEAFSDPGDLVCDPFARVGIRPQRAFSNPSATGHSRFGSARVGGRWRRSAVGGARRVGLAGSRARGSRCGGGACGGPPKCSEGGARATPRMLTKAWSANVRPKGG